MNALLIYPKMPPTFWTMDHLNRLVGKKSSYPPLGLLTVAALLPPHWNKRLVDMNIQPLDDDDLDWAEIVFLGAMNVQAPSAREVIARCKRHGRRVVAGGPLFTHEHERFPNVDHFVLNEAEITLPLFLRDLEAGTPQPIYSTKEFADVRQTPVPEWRLAKFDKYAYVIIQYSRGCPYMCDFCDVTALFGRRPRTKSAEQILRELDAIGDLDRFGLVMFADDNLIGNRVALKSELLPALIDWRRKNRPAVGFATQISINLADDDELMHLMLEAGFRHILIGIETTEEESLKAAGKTQNLRRSLLESVQKLHRVGFIVTGTFIVGFDTDTPAVFQRQAEFVRDSHLVIATMHLLKAPPHTDLYERLVREGRLIGEFEFQEMTTNIIPLVDPGFLRNQCEQLVNRVYSPEEVYRRIVMFLREKESPKVVNRLETRIRLMHVVILFRIIVAVGILGSERRWFWKLFFFGLLHPAQMDMVMLFAGLMHQFEEMRKRMVVSVPDRTRLQQSVVADVLPVMR